VIRTLCSLCLLGLVLGCSEAQQEDPRRVHEFVAPNESERLSPNLPGLFRDSEINCASFAEAVNHFVAMGQERAIESLRDLVAHKPQGTMWDKLEYRTACVCRVLFEPKRGEAPRLPGCICWGIVPWTSMRSEKWPLLPVIQSGSSFFVIKQCGVFTGLMEPSTSYLCYCFAHGDFRQIPVPMPNRPQARQDLEALRESATWKAINWQERSSGGGEKFILGEFARQAEQTPNN